MYPKIGNSIRVHAFVNWLYAHHDFDLISESAGWGHPRTELKDVVRNTIRLEIVRPFEESSLMISKCFFWILLCWMSLTYPRHIEYKKLMELWLAYWHGMFDMSRKNCRILIQFDMGLSLYLLPINNWPTVCTTTLPPFPSIHLFALFFLFK